MDTQPHLHSAKQAQALLEPLHTSSPIVIVCELLDCHCSFILSGKLYQSMLLPADCQISTWNSLSCGPCTAVGLADTYHLHFTGNAELLCQAACSFTNNLLSSYQSNWLGTFKVANNALYGFMRQRQSKHYMTLQCCA